MGDKHKKKKLGYTKPYRDKTQRSKMDAFTSRFWWCNKKYLKKIHNIEKNFNMVNSSSNPVHTLSYYIANTIDKGLETKYLHLMVDLMQKKDSIIFCDEKTAQRIIREVAFGNGYSALERLIEENEGNFYITGNLAHKLEEEPYLIRIENANISILDLLGSRKRPNIQTSKNEPDIQSRKIDTKKLADKKEAYIRIQGLLNEYFDILKYKAPNDGQRLINCICSILNLLRVFPEYINEDILINLFERIPISDEDYNQYLALLDSYNSINNDIKNGTATKYDMAKSIVLSSQMAEMIYPTMEDETIKAFFQKISPFFEKDIDMKKLSEDEEKELRDILSASSKDNFLLNHGKNLFEIESYLDYKDDHRIGLIGNKLFVLMKRRDGVFQELTGIEIHTIDEAYTIGITNDDKALKYKYEFDFNKIGGPCTLEVYMPLKGSRESVTFKTPDGKEERFTILNDGSCSVSKKTRTSDTLFEYNSYKDFLDRRPAKSQTTKNDEKNSIFDRVFPPKPIDQELNKITEVAIAHNIKGVIPKEILELYRTEMPIFATLIDNYGVRIPDESEMFRIPYYDGKDIQNDEKNEIINRDVSEDDGDIDI